MARGFPLKRVDAFAPAMPPRATFSQPAARPPSFANDNWRAPAAANDNFFGPHRRPGTSNLAMPPGLIAEIARPNWARGAMLGFRLAGAALGWFSLAMLVFQLVDAWRRSRPAHGFRGQGWELSCGSGWGGTSVSPPVCYTFPWNMRKSVAGPGPAIFQYYYWAVSWAANLRDGAQEYPPDPTGWYFDNISSWVWKPFFPISPTAPVTVPQLPLYQPLPRLRPRRSPRRSPRERPEEIEWPVIPPAWDPWANPPATPFMLPDVPIPVWLLPYRGFDPMMSPRERATWGNREPWEEVNRRDRLREWDFGVKGRPQERPSTHVNARPKPNEKERKVRPLSGSVYRVIARALSHVTEGLEIVDAFWDALPEKFRKREMAKRHGKPPNSQEKLRQIWLHWDQINLNEAIDNIVKNELEDRVFGFFGKQAGRAAARDGRATAYGTTRLPSFR